MLCCHCVSGIYLLYSFYLFIFVYLCFFSHSFFPYSFSPYSLSIILVKLVALCWWLFVIVTISQPIPLLMCCNAIQCNAMQCILLFFLIFLFFFFFFFLLITLCHNIIVYIGTSFDGLYLSLIHIWRCRRIERCRSRWSPYH